MAKLNDYLTVPECAALLEIHQQTVRRWLDSGDMPYIEKFSRKLIRRCDCKRPATMDKRGAHLLGRKRGGGE